VYRRALIPPLPLRGRVKTCLSGFLDITSNRFFFRWACVLVHGPQRALKKVVHRLDRSAFHLREAKVDEHHSRIREQGVKQERGVAHIGDHVGRGACDAVVDDPIDEEAEGHAERTLGVHLLARRERYEGISDARAYDSGWEDLCCYYIAGY